MNSGLEWPPALALAVVVHGLLVLVPMRLDSAPARQDERPPVAVRLPVPPEPVMKAEPEPVEPEPVEELPPPPEVEPPPELVEPPKPRPRDTSPPKPAPKKPEPEPEPEPEPAPVESAPPEAPAPAPSETAVRTSPRTSQTPPSPTPADKAASPSSTPKKQPAIDFGPYQRGLHRALIAERRYPPMARRLGLEGTAKVRVVLDRRGRLVKDAKITRSSGHELLDEEALAMVRRAAPFPALPDGISQSAVSFEIPVRFKLEG
jgi:periplasmic protein TonB